MWSLILCRLSLSRVLSAFWGALASASLCSSSVCITSLLLRFTVFSIHSSSCYWPLPSSCLLRSSVGPEPLDVGRTPSYLLRKDFCSPFFCSHHTFTRHGASYSRTLRLVPVLGYRSTWLLRASYLFRQASYSLLETHIFI